MDYELENLVRRAMHILDGRVVLVAGYAAPLESAAAAPFIRGWFFHLHRMNVMHDEHTRTGSAYPIICTRTTKTHFTQATAGHVLWQEIGSIPLSSLRMAGGGAGAITLSTMISWPTLPTAVTRLQIMI